MLLTKIKSNFYFGYYDNLNSKIGQHNNGKTESTKYWKPHEWINLFWACINTDDAIKRENFINHIKIECIIRKVLKII